jgi:hypothetical protein
MQTQGLCENTFKAGSVRLSSVLYLPQMFSFAFFLNRIADFQLFIPFP